MQTGRGGGISASEDVAVPITSRCTSQLLTARSEPILKGGSAQDATVASPHSSDVDPSIEPHRQLGRYHWEQELDARVTAAPTVRPRRLSFSLSGLCFFLILVVRDATL